MLFTKLIQVGMVTRDISKVIECFTDVYNIGPWYLIKFSNQNVDSMTLYGKKQDYSMELAVCPIGDVRFNISNRSPVRYIQIFIRHMVKISYII